MHCEGVLLGRKVLHSHVVHALIGIVGSLAKDSAVINAFENAQHIVSPLCLQRAHLNCTSDNDEDRALFLALSDEHITWHVHLDIALVKQELLHIVRKSTEPGELVQSLVDWPEVYDLLLPLTLLIIENQSNLRLPHVLPIKRQFKLCTERILKRPDDLRDIFVPNSRVFDRA